MVGSVPIVAESAWASLANQQSAQIADTVYEPFKSSAGISCCGVATTGLAIAPFLAARLAEDQSARRARPLRSIVLSHDLRRPRAARQCWGRIYWRKEHSFALISVLDGAVAATRPSGHVVVVCNSIPRAFS